MPNTVFYQRLVKSWFIASSDKAKAFVEKLPQAAASGCRAGLLATLITIAAVSGLKQLGALEPLELEAYDRLTRLTPKQGLDPNLLIVGVSEQDLQAYGWPLSDQIVASALGALQQHQPQVIGLDLYRNTPQPPGQPALAQQLAAENVIAIWHVGNAPTIGEVPAPATVPEQRLGFNDLVIDADGRVRRSLLFVAGVESTYVSFPLRVVQAYRGYGALLRADKTALYLGPAVLPRLKPGSGGYQNADNSGYQILTSYRSPAIPAKQITLQQLLKGQFNPALVTGKAVLLGTTAPSLKDEFYTPYSAGQQDLVTQSGVLIHAQVISQLLQATAQQPAIYRFLPAWGEMAWLAGWILFAAVVSWRLQHLRLLLGLGGGLLLLWGSVGLALSQLVWLPVVAPTLGVLLTSSLLLLQQILYRGTHDWVTNLPGRSLFLVQVQRALQIQSTHGVMVAFLDVNRFRLINQSLGHAIGDRVLQALAKRLQQTLPEGTQIARISGDEFALLFQQKPQTVVEASLIQLQEALSEPFQLDQHRLSLTASVGLAITQAGTDYTAADLLRDAHTAMYQAKALEEFSHQVFSCAMQEGAMARLQLESHLLQAFEANEFVLYYQPIVTLATGLIYGFEALVRWKHQERGFVSPEMFIPVVEETGLIVKLGEWIFRDACCQLKLWQLQLPDYPLKMSVNLSRRQFLQPDLVQQIVASLEASGINGDRIQLEITESMVMRNVEAARAVMLQLKRLGLGLAIDDFGTGYSSLSYLHRFPTDTLKIDRSFVSRMTSSQEDRDIVHTIITLGQKMKLALVAEGIETAEQMALLRDMGCQYGQGFWFSKPVSGEDAIALVIQQTAGEWLKID
jgi:diguanylate cyclase (GGDEF)-like protein